MRNEFPQVEVKFDIDSPTTPIIIHVRPHLDLLFSEYQQRLHTIVLKRFREVPPVTIRFKDKVLLGPDQILRRVDVSRVVGPTYEGEELRYPGVWFSFDEHTIPPQDQNQEIKSITVSQHNGQDRDALEEVLECPVMCGDIARAVAKVHRGVKLHLYPTTTSEPFFVEIGVTTAQDLSIELGAPPRTYYREDDRMHIHSRLKADEDDDDSPCEYSTSPQRFTCCTSRSDFYNYFQYGIDFLISGATHTVRKIILHTNIVSPATPNTVPGLSAVVKNSPDHLCSIDTNDAHGRLRGCQRMMKMVCVSPSGRLFPRQLL